MHQQIADVVRRFIQERFPGAAATPLDADARLFSSGIVDSFGVLELIAFLDERFGVDIDPARHELSEFDTLAKIATFVAEHQRPGEVS